MRTARASMKSFGSTPKGLAALCAAALLLLSGCQREATRESARRPSEASPETARAVPTPEAHILVDEAMLRKPHAIIGGTIENIAGERLENLSVELELRRREDSTVELRAVPVEPAALAPGEKGRYTLKVRSDEWSGSRLLRLRSSSRAEDVAFKTSPGARRPPERIPGSPTINVTKGTRPRPKSGGEEFINTPDTPVSVP